MPTWLIELIKVAIKYAGPLFLSFLKDYLEKKYPDFAQMIGELIGGIKDPNTPNNVARSTAMECLGTLCPATTKKV